MDFDALADTWDAEHGPTSARAREFAACLAVLTDTCRRFQRPRVLDAGCGTGLHLLALSDVLSEGVGIDISPGMVAQAQGKIPGRDSRLRFIVASAEELSAEAFGWFDLVFLIGSLEHMLDPECVLTRVRAVLAAHGEVVVIMRHPLHPSALIRRLTGGTRAVPRHRHVTPRELAILAERSGLKVAEMTPIVVASWNKLAPSHVPNSQRVWRHSTYAAHLVHREALAARGNRPLEETSWQ